MRVLFPPYRTKLGEANKISDACVNYVKSLFSNMYIIYHEQTLWPAIANFGFTTALVSIVNVYPKD